MGYSSTPNQNTVSGTLAQRPSATSVAPGTYYFATDTGGLSRSNGSTWDAIQLGSGSIADGGVDSADIATQSIWPHHYEVAQRFASGAPSANIITDQGGEVIYLTGTCTGCKLPGTGDHNRFRIVNMTGATVTIQCNVVPDTIAGGSSITVPDGCTIMCIGDDTNSNWRVVQETVPRVTALPATPWDGMEVTFQSSTMLTNGQAWRLRYNASESGSYKWEVIGGAPLSAENDTNDTRNNSTFGALTNATDITIPLAGDYYVECGCWFNSAAQTGAGLLSPTGAGITANDSYGVRYGVTAATMDVQLARSRRFTLTTGTLGLVARCTGGVATGFGNRYVKATPIRVG